MSDIILVLFHHRRNECHLNNSSTPQSATPVDRLVCIDGRFNFRDLGGYETEDGHRVRWRRVYRSGVMTHIGDQGGAHLAEMGIRVICDFRTTRERERAPTPWRTLGAADYWCRDYDHSDGEIQRFMATSDRTPENAREVMLESYRHLPFEQADAYRELYRRLAEGHVPLVFNCSVGKDRTGIAAALLLTLLGVPRRVIREDYALTNSVVARDSKTLMERGHLQHWNFEPAFLPLLQADPDYLDAMFAAIGKECGTVEGYLRDLGIHAQHCDAIRQELLEPV